MLRLIFSASGHEPTFVLKNQPVQPSARTKQTMADIEGIPGSDRRFSVALLIVHPTIEPQEIEDVLGLVATHVHRVGDQRSTPKGTTLPGKYPDTRWRYSIRYIVADQWFVEELDEFLDMLQPHKSFLKNLRDTGGTTCVIVGFLGDGHFGDKIPVETLTKFNELGVSLGIEIYTVPQN